MLNIIFMVFGALLVLEASIAQAQRDQFWYAWGAAQGTAWYAMLMGAFCFLFGLVGFLHRKKRRG
jgi:hypothetical protein